MSLGQWIAILTFCVHRCAWWGYLLAGDSRGSEKAVTLSSQGDKRAHDIPHKVCYRYVQAPKITHLQREHPTRTASARLYGMPKVEGRHSRLTYKPHWH